MTESVLLLSASAGSAEEAVEIVRYLGCFVQLSWNSAVIRRKVLTMRPVLLKALRLAFIGALAFWSPDTILHAIRRYSFDSPDVRFLTFAMPVTALVVLVVCAKLMKVTPSALAGGMLLGIWVLGGVFMVIGGSFSGGYFTGPDGIRGGLLMLAISWFPVITFLMATYDGSLGALVLISLVLLIVGILWKMYRSAEIQH